MSAKIDLSFGARGGPYRLVPIWRGWISGFAGGVGFTIFIYLMFQG